MPHLIVEISSAESAIECQVLFFLPVQLNGSKVHRKEVVEHVSQVFATCMALAACFWSSLPFRSYE